MYRIRLTHSDDAVTFTRARFDHETADRLAKCCSKDPAIKAAAAVPVAVCDCRSDDGHEQLGRTPWKAAA
jgi:hypothetical protein